MVTKHLMQRGMEQMRGCVIAHDVVTAGHIHFGNGLITYFGLARDKLSGVSDDSSRGTTGGSDFNLPRFAALIPSPSLMGGRESPSPFGRGQGEGTDISFIIYLTARLNVETSLWEDDFDSIIQRSGLNYFAVDDQRENLA